MKDDRGTAIDKAPRCRSYIAPALLVPAALVFCSCATIKLLDTNRVNFRCDSDFNEGMILPVELVYVVDGESIDKVTGVVPNEWFDSEVREQWPFRQSMSLRASNTRKTIEMDLKKPKRTIALVIVADYRNIDDAKPQVIILKAEDGKEVEDVFITINGLLH